MRSRSQLVLNLLLRGVPRNGYPASHKWRFLYDPGERCENMTGLLCGVPSLRRYASQNVPVKKLEKILVANRGEIALRVMRTAKRLGMKTVAVYSEADVDSLHVRFADEAICVGPAASAKSYLNVEAIMSAIHASKADCLTGVFRSRRCPISLVHPGYGFLSENAAFVKKLEAVGVTFVGPTASAIAAMGDKIESKKLAKDAGVNTIPGCQDVIIDEDHAAKIAKDVGYPVMLKASAGGGGKGMRTAWNEEETRESYRLCHAEALSSFGDGRIFIERFIEQPRHIEIQVLGDAHGNVVYLPERECSIQRRNQKVIEEAPSVFLDEETRQAMGQQALALAQAVNYQSSGTVEFLVDKFKRFYFLEMNTRLQVEHPVTECVTGLDLVEHMIKVASGEKLEVTQERAAQIHGWSIEARIYAEDPKRGFLPMSGRLKQYSEPVARTGKESVRVDSGVEEGSEISIHYDPMISKLAAWGPDRNAALNTLECALDRYVIKGLVHNLPFLRSIISHPAFVEGNFSTKFIQEHYPEGWKRSVLSVPQQEDLVALMALLHTSQKHYYHPKAGGARWPLDLVITVGEEDYSVAITSKPGEDPHEIVLEVDVNNKTKEVSKQTVKHWAVDAVVDGRSLYCQILNRLPRGFQVLYQGSEMDVLVQSPLQASLCKYMKPPPADDFSKVLRAPMAGSLISVAVRVGQEVAAGDELAVLEAMKMRNVLRAEQSGVVKSILGKEGATLAVDEVIVEFQ